MEFCRGACFRLFGDYAAYGDVDPKKLPRNRYFVIGFGGAKVFDMNAPHAAGKGDTLGVRLPNGHIIRQLYVYEDQKNLSLHLSNPDGGQHKFRLHRLISHWLISNGLSIYSSSTILKELGIDTEHYDRQLQYRPLQGWSNRSKEGVDLTDGQDSETSDVDHRRGRDQEWLDGALTAQGTSHRMNICFGLTRKNAGHWCFCLMIMEYNGGTKSSKIEPIPALQELMKSKEWAEATAKGVRYGEFNKLPEFNVLQILPPLTLKGDKMIDDESDTGVGNKRRKLVDIGNLKVGE